MTVADLSPIAFFGLTIGAVLFAFAFVACVIQANREGVSWRTEIGWWIAPLMIGFLALYGMYEGIGPGSTP